MRRVLALMATLAISFTSVIALEVSPANATGVDGNYSCTISGGYTVSAGVLSNGQNCVGVANVPEGVTDIDEVAFQDSQVTSISLPSSLRTMGDQAFSHATSLDSIDIPLGVTTIGYGAFRLCDSLVAATIPASVTDLGESIFDRSSSLSHVLFHANVTSIPANTFKGASSLTSFVVPEGITSIGRRAFRGASSLDSIEIPEGVTSIGDEAFSYSGLSSVQLPNSLTSLGAYAFEGANSLIKANLPDGLTSVPDGVFASTALRSIVIPASVTSIGAGAFQNSQLTSISIPFGISSIGNYAFNSATRLSSIRLPDGVTSIGDYAFSGADSLVSVSIPSTVTTLGMDVFSYSTSLQSIYFGGNAPASSGSQDLTSMQPSLRVLVQSGATGFGSTWNGITVAFSARNGLYACNTGVLSNSSSVARYEIADGAVQNGSACVGAVVIASGVPTIAAGAFFGSGITSITIPDAITAVEDFAFYGTGSLTSITVSSSNPVYSSAGGVLFDKLGTTLVAYPAAKAGTAYTVPTTVLALGAGAFAGATSLSQIVLPDGLLSIGDSVFDSATALVTLSFGSSLNTVFYNSFSGTSSLNSIHVASSNNYFSDVEGVLFNKTQTELVDYPSARTSTHYTVPSGVRTIGSQAFCNVVALTSVSMPSSLDSIGVTAFWMSSSLSNFYFRGNAPAHVASQAFQNVANGAVASIQPGATGFGGVGTTWNGLTIAVGSDPNQSQQQQQNNNQQQTQNSAAIVTAAPLPKFDVIERPRVSTNGQSLTLNGQNFGDVKSLKVGGKEAMFTNTNSGQLVIEVPAGTAGYPEIVIVSSSGTLIMQGLIQVVAPYSDKRTATVTATKNGQLTSASLAALKKSYKSAPPANVISCSATVASNASVKDVALARKTAKATCQAMVEFSSYINTVNVQVSKTGRAGSKLALAVTFDRTLTGK
jgi:BspA type Leucine rich repeat region (6 copies)